MKEPQTTPTTISPQETQESPQGHSLMPPQFKLEASSGGASKKGSHASEFDADGAAGVQGYTERVANFGRLGDEVVAASKAGDLPQLMVALEALKHDQPEFSQFKSYFEKKFGIGLEAYLVGQFGEEVVGPLLRNMQADLSTIPATNVAQLVAESIAEDNPNAVMSLLIAYGKASVIAEAYATQYPGQSLRNDLQAMAVEDASLSAFLKNFFGEAQNY